MNPTFQTDSINSINLWVNPSSFQKWDSIQFQTDNKLITHRIIAVQEVNKEISYKTKGDNNDGPDLWTVYPQNIVGQYSNFTIPYVGYALYFVST